jgi:hypothetical protein
MEDEEIIVNLGGGLKAHILSSGEIVFSNYQIVTTVNSLDFEQIRKIYKNLPEK